MKVLFISRSGGLANLRLHGEVDTDDLPSELGERASVALQAETLRNLAPSTGGVPDGFQLIEVRVQTEAGEYETFMLDDPTNHPELCDVLEGLIQALMQKRR